MTNHTFLGQFDSGTGYQWLGVYFGTIYSVELVINESEYILGPAPATWYVISEWGIFGDHLQCGMSVVAPVWVVKHLLDPCPLCGGDTDIVEGGGDIAHYIVHGGVDFVRIESPLGLGVTDSEATLP